MHFNPQNLYVLGILFGVFYEIDCGIFLLNQERMGESVMSEISLFYGIRVTEQN